MAQNNIIKQDLLINTADSFIVINPTKQQIAFFPKEESQMFTGKEVAFTGTRPADSSNDPENESESKDTLAFIERAKDPSNGASGGSIDYVDFYGGVPGGDPMSGTEFKYDFNNISSSHTETNYIGAIKVDVPTIINETFATFNLYNLSTAFSSPFYQTTDTTAKTSVLFNGVQTLRIPANVFNTILTDQTAIIANNNNPTVQNFGLYYIIVAPSYVRTTVGNIINRVTHDWLNMYQNGDLSYSTPNSLLSITPGSQRRTVYECPKSDFQSLLWNFEGSGLQSGRLYGSVVEVWDAGETTLKQVKVMTENEFNFSNPSATTHFALYPDNVGYDAPSQKIITGDILHIYPRETYFDQMIIQINYQNGALSVQNLIQFMMNDATRDITTGVYQVYDSNGFTIDTSGNFNGNVLKAFQIFSSGKIEARKTLNNPQGL